MLVRCQSGINSGLQVICSDKTGTLTTNQMAIAKIAVPEAPFQMREFEVSGELTALGCMKVRVVLFTTAVGWLSQRLLGSRCMEAAVVWGRCLDQIFFTSFLEVHMRPCMWECTACDLAIGRPLPYVAL